MADTPDPRVTRSREAILAAARELLREEGPSAVTHQRVAARAEVGRATVYRHWPRPEQLLTDAMADVPMPFFLDPATPVRPWLERQLRMLADQLALPDVLAVTTALVQGARSEPQITTRRDRLATTIGQQLRAALTMAEQAGELQTACDPRDAPALLIGPLLYRSLLEPGPVSDDLIDRLLHAAGTWTAGSAISNPPAKRPTSPTTEL
ncbi:TetR/AcrR family transcriptional regulator [Acrocarpospora macrocephala]|uniref:TetR family transcriptional regulator n=1 Tax=Acrocarpospora macrocephala TaxID=150177 RepID=A0A5M3XDT3_9ACTN|nr:TetR/AcrR family transcriptional regulator [Acrocarpospora macrocephala]GES16228.1 TetR family transcriptional regulator [Acrocarpospora macrocephala]